MNPTNNSDESFVAWQSEKAITRLGGEKVLIHKLATLFVRDSPSLIEIVKHAIQQQRYDDAFTALHSLQGTSANFYAARFEVECKQLQQALKSHHWQEAEINFEQLTRCYEELEKELVIFISNGNDK
jgi:HPt (histidine-containing phosphotransfer) domain-containing protein